MSEKPSCAKCSAYSALSNECRRHAPQPLALPDPHKPGDLRVVGMFPGVSKTHWCLDYVPEVQVSVQIVSPAKVA